MKNFSVAVSLAMLVLFLSARLATADEPAKKPAASPAADNAPKTIDEALARLEALLGKHSDTLKHEWRFPVETETAFAEKDQPGVHVTLRGVTILSTPYRFGNSIAFDQISAIERTHFDLAKAGAKTKKYASQTHRAERIVLRQVKDVWFFDVVQISSSNDGSVGLPERLGSVTWLPSGIRLIGSDSASIYFGPDGQKTLGAAVTTTEITRDGETLVNNYRSIAYALLKTPEGELLQVPDLTKPIGKPFSLRTKSQDTALSNLKRNLSTAQFTQVSTSRLC